MYKLLALDLDGTLLMPDRTIPQELRVRLRGLQEQGIIITLATGRMFSTAARYAVELGLTVPVVCYNGAVVRSSDGAAPLFSRPLELELQKRIIDFCESRGWYVQLYNEERIIVGRFCEHIAADPDAHGNRTLALGSLRDKELLPSPKLMTRASEQETDRRGMILKEHFGDELFITESDPHLVEMMMRDVNKSASLEMLCGLYGVKREEVVCCGDSANDRDMLRWAGCGCAVGNSTAELKESADYVCRAANSFGVLEVIDRFF